MSDPIFLETEESPAGNLSGAGAQTKNRSAGCSMQGKGWFKGALGMAICCAAPILLFAAISSFWLVLGAIASGTLRLAVLLACPVGMFLNDAYDDEKEARGSNIEKVIVRRKKTWASMASGSCRISSI